MEELLKYFVWQSIPASFFDVMTAKYTLKPTGKRKHRRDSMMSKTEVMLVMIPFHGSGYRCFIETVNDELKNISQVEHSIHRYFDRFIINLLQAITTYFLFPKKPSINAQRSFTLPLHRSESVELTLITNLQLIVGIIFQGIKKERCVIKTTSPYKY